MNYRKQMRIISACNCRLNVLYGEWAKLHGVTLSKLMILEILYQQGFCTQKQIVDALALPKQTVNTVIKELQKQEYILYNEGRNQKEKRISFTEEGKRFAATIVEEMWDFEEHILARIGEKECEVIAESMEKFANIFEQEVDNYGK